MIPPRCLHENKAQRPIAQKAQRQARVFFRRNRSIQCENDMVLVSTGGERSPLKQTNRYTNKRCNKWSHKAILEKRRKAREISRARITPVNSPRFHWRTNACRSPQDHQAAVKDCRWRARNVRPNYDNNNKKRTRASLPVPASVGPFRGKSNTGIRRDIGSMVVPVRHACS